MSKATISARHATRLVASYRRALADLRKETNSRKAEATCDAIVKTLTLGGREDLAMDLHTERYLF